MTTARSVLIVVHSVTAINRFADILAVFDSDCRVQLIFTFPDASAVAPDVAELLARRGALVMPWAQAVVTPFDLALTAHHSGNLHDIAAPLVVLSHGMGYTKHTRNPKSEIRNPKSGTGSVYGLSAEWLLRGGTVVPSAIALSHDEQLARLAESVPEAVDAAVVVGDPCFDRMAASEDRRRSYRARLGVDDDTTAVLLSSTWGDESLFGRYPRLAAELLAELPCDRYVVAAVLHPNTWYAHGPHQIRLWLGDALRAGLRLVPPVEGWQQAVIAADVVIGDNGAVTGYAAALGRPTMPASFPPHRVVAGSAIGELGRVAPRFDMRLPYRPQIDAVTSARGSAGVRALTTSVPGQSPQLLRRLFYRLMDLPEPDRAALLAPYEPADLDVSFEQADAWWVAAEPQGSDAVVMTRWPADVVAPHDGDLDRHLVIASDHPRRDLFGNAAIVVAVGRGKDVVSRIFLERPACRLVVSGDVVVHRDGWSVAVVGDRVLAASAIHRLLVDGLPAERLPRTLTVDVCGRRAEVDLEVKR